MLTETDNVYVMTYISMMANFRGVPIVIIHVLNVLLDFHNHVLLVPLSIFVFQSEVGLLYVYVIQGISIMEVVHHVNNVTRNVGHVTDQEITSVLFVLLNKIEK